MGIARDDKPMRQDWVLRGFRQFDAPVSLVLAYDRAVLPDQGLNFKNPPFLGHFAPLGIPRHSGI